jgi:hypothetical protein
MLAGLVGALILSRAVDDPQFSEETQGNRFIARGVTPAKRYPGHQIAKPALTAVFHPAPYRRIPA